MHPTLKHYLKKYFLYFKVKNKLHSKEGNRQRGVLSQLKQTKITSTENSKYAFKNFSQHEEDGLLLAVISQLEKPVPLFLEFGSDDGVNSNSANLHFHHNWTGLFIDGNKKAIERGKYFYSNYGNKQVSAPTFIHSLITRENINELISQGGLKGEIGLLSIDIDGNDYWVWEAIKVISPQIVVIETHNEFGLNDIVVPYDKDYFYPGKHPDYHGASPIAMTNLARHLGYRLVACNDLGFNFIFLRNDLAPHLVEISVESCLQHPSNKECQARFEQIKDWEYIWNRKFS